MSESDTIPVVFTPEGALATLNTVEWEKDDMDIVMELAEAVENDEKITRHLHK